MGCVAGEDDPTVHPTCSDLSFELVHKAPLDLEVIWPKPVIPTDQLPGLFQVDAGVPFLGEHTKLESLPGLCDRHRHPRTSRVER